MSTRIRLLASSVFAAALLFAAQPSSAQAVSSGCTNPVFAVEGYIDEWFASFTTNGIAGFEKLCLRMCKTGAKGCDNVQRATVDCNEASARGLFGVDALQCNELDGDAREQCLASVAQEAADFLAAFLPTANAAAAACADAAEDCRDICTGPI